MKIVIQNSEGKNWFRIYPYENGLCWCIDRYTEVIPKDPEKQPYWKWVFTQKYPANMQAAVSMVLKMMEVEDETVVKDLKGMEKALQKHRQLVLKAIEKGK